jgi:hypothetical protein
MCTTRATISDPAAKENRAMAQTVHPLEFQLANFQQLRVIEVSFSILTKVLTRCSGGEGALLFRPLIHPVVNGFVRTAHQIQRVLKRFSYCIGPLKFSFR